ncbi:MAG: hypothetical protein H6839_04780 [Planctomycetes bacterium]|nr:hypothetical protein [Planctomycetota bacterium]
MSSSETEPQAAPEAELPKAPKKVRFLRLKAAVALPLLFGVAIIVYWLMIDGVIADQLVAQGKAYAGKGGEAQVGRVHFSIFGPKLEIDEMRVWQDLGDGREHEVAYLGSAKLDIEFWPLLERRFVVNDIRATAIRYQGPRKEKAEPETADVPTDTNQPELNDYLKQVKDILQSEEIDSLRDWMEKLHEYMEEKEAPPDEEPSEPPPPQEEPEELGPSGRASYVEEALGAIDAEPTVVIKHASLDELAVTFGREDKNRFAYKVTDLELSAESVSSDPVLYKQPMLVKAAGNLDGLAERRVELGLTVRFDPKDLVTLEQVDGTAGIKTVNISSLVDPKVFGGTLSDARLMVTHFASDHAEFSGRTRLQLSGSIQPPNFKNTAKASFSLWFGGFRGTTTASAFLPSGISVQVEDFPLNPILDLAGGSPLKLANDQATISFGTVDSNGRYATPESALSWHDGIKVHMRLQVKGLSFADPEGDLAGLPGTFVTRGLNRVIDGMGGLDVIVGFQGSKNRIALDLEKPGLRAFIDAVINALTLTAPEIKSLIDLPFEVSSSATFGLASMNADGTVRDPKLSLDGEARHDLNDLRVGLNLRDTTIAPKPGQTSIIGLPANDFCRAFNAFMATLGPDGLSIRTRIMNEAGTFSPALESPGLRGIVDALAGVLSYSGQQMNTQFKLPFKLSPNAMIQCESVETDGTVRTLRSPGADSDDFKNLRIRLRASNFTVSPKPGEPNILGLPAEDFCQAFNNFITAQGDGGLAFDWGILDKQGNFAPELLSPGTRGIVDSIAGTLQYTGAQLNSRFNLPLTIAPQTVIKCESVDTSGNPRTLRSSGADSHDLGNFRLRLRAANFTVSPKAGQGTILGIPAKEFCTAFNSFVAAQGTKGVALDWALLDAQSNFSPALKQPGTRGLVDGIVSTLRYTGVQLNDNFNLPFKLMDTANITASSIEQDGKVRRIDGPDSGSNDLKGLTIAVVLKEGFAAKKDGVNTILGIPADYFTFAWNKLQASYGPTGMPMRLRLFNEKGEYAPGLLAPTETELIKQIGTMVGIGDFKKDFTKLAEKYANDFPAFQKDGLKVAKDIAEGKFKAPELPKDPPKDPPIEIPKLPWGK